MVVLEFTKEDQGKTVVSADGDRIGRVADTRGGTAYVQPDHGAADTIKSKLGWGDTTEDTYPLNGDDVDEVTDAEIRLQPF